MTTSYFETRMTARETEATLLGEILRLVLTVILPPAGVALRTGLSVQLVISVLLTCLGYLPGLVHGVWVIAQTSSHRLKV